MDLARAPGAVTTLAKAGVTSADRLEVWSEIVADAYARFEPVDYRVAAFNVALRSRSVAGMSLVGCSGTACSGRRSASTVRRDGQRRFGIQVLLAGDERMTCGESQVVLGPGSVVFWDSALPSRFEVDGRIEKATIVFAEELLRERLPRNVPLASTLIDAGGGIGALLRAHVTTIVAHLDSFEDDDAALRNMTLDLLSAALLRAAPAADAGDSRRKLARIQAYVRAHLGDPDLTPARIALVNGISLRYLHLLFHASGTTAAAWVKEQRLLSCRDELVAASTADCAVADVAFRHGLLDPANFSRDFKRRFGCSPSALRERLRERAAR